MEIFKLVGNIFVDSQAAEESISKTDEKGKSLASTLGNGIATAAKWGAGIATAATAAVTGLTAAANIISAIKRTIIVGIMIESAVIP